MHYATDYTCQCSECGSNKWENFNKYNRESGIRCLKCGHEKVTFTVEDWEKYKRSGYVIMNEDNKVYSF